jgi:undecaprenyl-diphosphatase
LEIDSQLSQAINALAGRSALLDAMMLELGHGGNLLVPGALLLALWLRRNWREALIGSVALAGLIGAGDFIGAQLKVLAQRVRPCHVLSSLHQLTACGGTFSFPSNHALNTAAAAAFLQVLYPVTGWVTWPIVFLAGISRVYVGAHYVTDVLGGWVIGGVLGGGLGLALVRWRKFRPVPLSGKVLGGTNPSGSQVL